MSWKCKPTINDNNRLVWTNTGLFCSPIFFFWTRFNWHLVSISLSRQVQARPLSPYVPLKKRFWLHSDCQIAQTPIPMHADCHLHYSHDSRGTGNVVYTEYSMLILRHNLSAHSAVFLFSIKHESTLRICTLAVNIFEKTPSHHTKNPSQIVLNKSKSFGPPFG